MEQKKSKKGLFLALGVLAVVVVACLAFYFAMRPQGTAGEKTVVVQVVHGDGSTRDFTLQTGEEFLGKALVEGKVVEDNQAEYGLYILTVDGETADEAKQEWWCITKGGGEVSTGADTTPIAHGERYELTLTVGFDD